MKNTANAKNEKKVLQDILIVFFFKYVCLKEWVDATVSQHYYKSFYKAESKSWKGKNYQYCRKKVLFIRKICPLTKHFLWSSLNEKHITSPEQFPDLAIFDYFLFLINVKFMHKKTRFRSVDAVKNKTVYLFRQLTETDLLNVFNQWKTRLYCV